MRLPRPYIPLDVRLQVAEKMYYERFRRMPMVYHSRFLTIERILGSLFGNDKVHLDHDPALINRRFNEKTGRYDPDANDPQFLIYRTKTSHEIKTRVRGDGAKYSDLALRRKNKRIANKDRPIRKIQSRPFPKRPV